MSITKTQVEKNQETNKKLKKTWNHELPNRTLPNLDEIFRVLEYTFSKTDKGMVLKEDEKDLIRNMFDECHRKHISLDEYCENMQNLDEKRRMALFLMLYNQFEYLKRTRENEMRIEKSLQNRLRRIAKRIFGTKNRDEKNKDGPDILP